MNWIKQLVITLAIVISLFLIFSQTAYASIDFGAFDQTTRAYYIGLTTASILIQVLIGVFAGGLVMIGVYRMRVINLLHNLFKKRKGDEESA